MSIVPGNGLLLKIPYADGGPANKQRPFLVIDVSDNIVKMLNVSSTRGKERKLMFSSNERLHKYIPPFCRPSFVKLDGLYEVEYFEELEYLVLAGGKTLDPDELERIKNKFKEYAADNKVNFSFNSKADVLKYSFSYITEKIIAASKE